jgi:hypothetical protein
MLSLCWPDKLAFVEPSGCQPDANSVMHEHLHAIGPAVGKQVGVVGVRRAEHLDHSAKSRIRARTHVQWLYCQPDAVDSNHLRTQADQQANSLAADMGHDGHDQTALAHLHLDLTLHWLSRFREKWHRNE